MLTDNDFEIIGEDLQAVKIRIADDKSVISDPGNLVYLTDNIKMNVTLGKETFGQKLLSGFKRALVGENFFLTNFQAESGIGEIVFSSPVPGKILPVRLNNNSIICQKQSYLCSEKGISIEVAFARKLGAGIFGKEGFILQKLTGEGIAFIQASGSIIKKTLNEGERIKLDPGGVVAFDPSIDYDIRFVGNISTAIFGGVGLFFVTLTGPGDVYLQTLPINKLSRNILNASKKHQTKPKG